MNLAFVLLADAKLPDAREIARAFGGFSPDEGRPLGLKGDERSGGFGVEVLEFDLPPDGAALVALMPTPVPNGEADSAVRFSVSAVGTTWKLPEHQAHLVVTLEDASADSPTDTLSRFTALVAAVTETSDAVGVYWGSAGATHDPKFFLDIARERELASRVMVWTGISLARETEDRVSFLSRGMKQFELPDLLLIAPRSAGNAALGTFFDLIAYAVSIGTPLPEGDTVGRTAEEHLPVHYVPSPTDPSTKVWRVELK
jgi:hypothetical protein